MRRLRVVVAGLLERGSAIAFGDGVAQALLVDDALAPGLEAVERRGVEVRGAVLANRGRRASAETFDLVLALGLGDDVQRVGFMGGARQLATLGRALEDGLHLGRRTKARRPPPNVLQITPTWAVLLARCSAADDWRRR